MRIAQIAPLYESVPPQAYGGTERVVSYLTEELVAQGHDVTLFASGDSTTSAQLVACAPQSLRLDPGCRDPLARHFLMLERVFQRLAEFDVLHFHIDYLHFPLSRLLHAPSLTTLHGRLDLPDLVPLYDHYRDVPLVSISDAQRKPLPRAGWRRTVHHGLPASLLRLDDGAGGYLAFLGRISPEKQPDEAIRIALEVGIPLRIAAKVDRADAEYFKEVVQPLLDHPLVEFVGEIGETEKQAFLGKARALLFPIDWPEPFGLVLIEAMACGTPVVAYRCGSVPEVLEDGVTGFQVQDRASAVAAVRRAESIDRRRCRAAFEARFTAARMASDYLAVYREELGAPPEVAEVDLSSRGSPGSPKR